VRSPRRSFDELTPQARYQRRRRANDPAYREQARLAAKAHYQGPGKAQRHTPEGRRRVWDGQLRSRFGITADEYDAMLAAQGGRCAICRREPDGRSRLAVEHDHKTRRIRGLVCRSCNRTIALIEGVIDRLPKYEPFFRFLAS
jgi:hypothetical protein